MNKVFCPPGFELPPGFEFVGWVTRPPIDDDALIEMRRGAARLRQARWRAENIEQARAIDRNQSRKERDVHYNRPFWAIDSEGQNYPENNIEYDGEGVPYRDHNTYLWGACAQDGEPIWLKDPATNGLDKRPLSSRQIMDWLLDLPEQASRRDKRGAVFAMFASGYDITQILKGLPYKTVWEICKGKTYPDENGVSRDVGRSPVLWQGYAVSYLKGKYFRLWRLRDPDQPFIINKRGKRVIDASAMITIYDVFGFFQSSFSKVADSMVRNGRATEDEAELIRTTKPLRGKFNTLPIERIEKYTTAELRLLARQMTDYRDGFAKINLRLAGWHGAGAAAAALFRRERFRDHFGDHIEACDISPQQDAANRAMFGGRIELLKQGLTGDELHVLDVASAYPAGMIELPSMAGGRWLRSIAVDHDEGRQRHRRPSSSVWPMDQAGGLDEGRGGASQRAQSAWPTGALDKVPIEVRREPSAPPMKRAGALGPKATLKELRAAIEALSPVSLLKIRFEFPIIEKLGRDPIDWKYIPFFPLPYRTKHGGIIFPANGHGWYMRDEALAAIAWLERFCPNYPALSKGMVMMNKNTKAIVFDIEETWIFEVALGAEKTRPFESIRELYNERRAIKEESDRNGVYDIREKSIKLPINSVYGKLAQSVGEKGIVPPTANPYYAAATTAYCRRRLLEAALIDPYAIVFFATDGIVSTRPLAGLKRVRKNGEKVDLGDWEYVGAERGLFVYPGLYTYGKAKYDVDGKVVAFEPVTKMRGADPKKFTNDEADQWIIKTVLAAWRKPYDPDNPPCIEGPFTKYITAGNALASRD
jgi:hypothetical protein